MSSVNPRAHAAPARTNSDVRMQASGVRGIDGSWPGACVPQINKPLLTTHFYGIRLRRCWLSSYCTQHSTTQATSHAPSPRPRPTQATQREIGTEFEETPETLHTYTTAHRQAL